MEGRASRGGTYEKLILLDLLRGAEGKKAVASVFPDSTLLTVLITVCFQCIKQMQRGSSLW